LFFKLKINQFYKKNKIVYNYEVIKIMNINIIIMSGGLGKRMKSELPKVLHKVNKIPMVVRVIKEAIKLNPKNILLVVGKYKNIIKKTLKEYNVLEEITFIIQ